MVSPGGGMFVSGIQIFLGMALTVRLNAMAAKR